MLLLIAQDKLSVVLPGCWQDCIILLHIYRAQFLRFYGIFGTTLQECNTNQLWVSLRYGDVHERLTTSPVPILRHTG